MRAVRAPRFRRALAAVLAVSLDPHGRLPVARGDPLPELRSRDDARARSGRAGTASRRPSSATRSSGSHGREARLSIVSRGDGDRLVRFRCWPFGFPGGAAADAHPVRERPEDRHPHARRRAARLRGRRPARVLEEGGERAQVRLRVRRVPEGPRERRHRRADARRPRSTGSRSCAPSRPRRSSRRLLLVHRDLRGNEVRERASS